MLSRSGIVSWLALLLLPVLVGSQEVEPALCPEGLAERIRGQIAQRWHVPPESVELEVGLFQGGAVPSVDAEVTLLGAGVGGHWVARLSYRRGATESVRVRAGVRSTVPVAARDLARGTELASGDIRFEETLRWGEPVSDVESIDREGWVTQRLLREGERLRAPAVQPPLAVRSGQPVALVWQRGGVGLRVSGKAAGSAPVGQEVFVRTESGRRLKGVVVAPGVVNVTHGGTEG